MKKNFLICLILFLISFYSIGAMEEEEDPPPLHGSGLPLTSALGAEGEGVALYNPRGQAETLFESMNHSIFDYNDPWPAVGLRWFGRLNGFLAENAMVPMILYVVLSLLDVPTSGALENAIVSIFMVYLFLPSTENMALGFESVYDFFSGCCQREPEIPVIYKQINPYYPLLSSIVSKIHAGGMAIILANIFHSIEDSRSDHYNWFFWTCVWSYVMAIYNKNITFFKAGQSQESVHRLVEDIPQQKKREILNQCLREIDEGVLYSLDPANLRKLYDLLKDTDKSIFYKLRLMGNLHRQRQRQPTNIQADEGSALLVRDAKLRHWSPAQEVADHVTNLGFYGSVIPEYYLYHYGTGLLLSNVGITGAVAHSVIGNICASSLSVISFFREGQSVKKFYKQTFTRLFRSPYSASNPNLRRGLGIKSFTLAGIIALSEIYPAWQNTLSVGNAAYPLLVLLGFRHHARNGHWLQKGYDSVITHWHLRTCGRDHCCCVKCRRGESREEMINFISVHYVHGLMGYIDKVNADGVGEISKAFFEDDEEQRDY